MWNDDKTKYLLRVWLYVKRKDNGIMLTFSAGIDGQADRMDSEARELLKSAYHLYMFRYGKEKFSGMSSTKFIETLNAEGVPCSR